MNATPTSRPSSVTTGVILLVINLLIGLVSSFYTNAHSEQLQSMADQLPAIRSIANGMTIILYALGFFFVYKIHQGRNWARVTMLVLYILGTLSLVASLFVAHAEVGPAWAKMTQGITTVLAIAAFISLFTGQSNAFFKKQAG